ncbi:MAG TPA: ABC-type transport auxiliary lipoprotein family protein, partial [Burkholderiales bacterium]|nr:ABC-type transport auxiliary lipoprotein family protein [Burkholderiales bacterium]
VEVAWTVRRTNGGEPGFGRTLVRERVEGTGYEALVAAHSRALGQVSAQIAQSIRAREDARVVRSSGF